MNAGKILGSLPDNPRRKENHMPSSPKIPGEIQISNVTGSNADPPDPAPFRIDLTVQPGSFVEGTGGGCTGVSATVIARIDGSNSGLHLICT